MIIVIRINTLKLKKIFIVMLNLEVDGVGKL